MRDVVDRIRAAGAELVVLGNGTVDHAAWFVNELKLDSPVVTDPSRRAYVWRILDPRVFVKALGVMLRGFRQKPIAGDALQLGGVFVIRPDGSVPFAKLSGYAGDHPEPARILTALRPTD